MTDQHTRERYERAGIADNEVGFGETPVLVVVDVQQAFTDPECRIGADMTEMVARANDLIAAARDGDVPVVFTRTVGTHPRGADFGVWIEKFPTLDVLIEGSGWIGLDERLDAREEAFHETELDSMLTAWGADTVVLCGCTTSGCIRATGVDACSHGYRTHVAADGVADRADRPHESNLFDLGAKYADVRPTDDLVEYLRG
ncbi:MAG: isochorismatase family protein [Salinigranum sp.]